MNHHAISMNPATGEQLSAMPFETPEQLDTALAGNHAAFNVWRNVPLALRADKLRHLGAALRQHAETLAQMFTA